MSTVTCGYCGETFAEDLGQPTCASCPLRGGCRMVRCPRCGYENPAQPEWLMKLRRWLGSSDSRAALDAAAAADDGRDAREEVSVR